MVLSVNTNSSALAVLAALNKTNANLADTQTQVASGLKIGAAKDNPTVYAVAQRPAGGHRRPEFGDRRAQPRAVDLRRGGLRRSERLRPPEPDEGQGPGGHRSDPGSGQHLAALNTDFKSLISQIQQAVSGASFEGSNLLDGSATNGLKFMATADGSGLRHPVDPEPVPRRLDHHPQRRRVHRHSHRRDRHAGAGQHLDRQRQQRGGGDRRPVQPDQRPFQLRLQAVRHPDHRRRRAGGCGPKRPKALASPRFRCNSNWAPNPCPSPTTSPR